MMRGINKVFKTEIQKAIKEIAEKHGMSPISVLVTTGEAFSEYQTSLEQIARRLASEFDIDPKNFFQMNEDFEGEIQEFIAPGWNPTSDPSGDNPLSTYLNKRLVEEGHPTINPDSLDFLFDEIQTLQKPEPKEE